MDYGIKKKTLVLGSSENVKFCGQKGFFSTVVAAYNNHYILKTCPEDWWMSIRKVSTYYEIKIQLTVSLSSVLRT